MPGTNASKPGPVFLVGAGPGDPGLLTLRGQDALRRADVVLYDYLANPQLLEHAPAGAELVCLGRHGQGRLLSQNEIHQRMIAAAQAGKTVVRLKSGDPLVFARAWEELSALHAAGIAYEIVPGVTAGLAAASYAGVPSTHRDHASAVALITGHEDDAKAASALDWPALAQFPGTLVVYMGVTTVAHWSQALMAAGKSADTPVVVVRRCSWPNQKRHVCTLGDVAEVVATHRLRPPVVFLIGAAVESAELTDWFGSRPLFGKRVVVTRAEHQSGPLRDKLQQLGAEALLQPAITILPPEDWSLVDDAIASLPTFDWLVFSSANGVRMFCDRLHDLGRDARQLAGVKMAAIGPGTAAELANYHLHADLQPTEYRAEALAASILAADRPGAALLARASRGRDVLADELRRGGVQVTEVVTYRSEDVPHANPEIAAMIEQGQVDWITVTSSAIARSVARLFGKSLRSVRLASMSPITSATLRELGYSAAAEARQYTLDGVVQAIIEAEQTGDERHE